MTRVTRASPPRRQHQPVALHHDRAGVVFEHRDHAVSFDEGRHVETGLLRNGYATQVAAVRPEPFQHEGLVPTGSLQKAQEFFGVRVAAGELYAGAQDQIRVAGHFGQTRELSFDAFFEIGELRAIGDVLCEQLAFMLRSGFDSFEMQSVDALDEFNSVVTEVRVVYQPTADGQATAIDRRGLRRPW